MDKLLTKLGIPHVIKGDKTFIADKQAAMRVKAAKQMSGGAKRKAKPKPKAKAKKPKSKKKVKK